MLKTHRWGLLLAASLLAGCVTSAPRSFTVSQSVGWATVEVRDGLDYPRAWDTVLDLLVRDFDLEVAWREDGYLRTAWLYTWSGTYQAGYRVRVTVKFSPDRTRIQFRPEAQLLTGQDWRIGSDARLVSTLKTDLMGTVGRTTR